eukprot:scaffold22738_cov31-Tisochrysis_lutea.AAC.10
MPVRSAAPDHDRGAHSDVHRLSIAPDVRFEPADYVRSLGIRQHTESQACCHLSHLGRRVKPTPEVERVPPPLAPILVGEERRILTHY